MEIVIVGYGRMGHEIEELALKRGHKILARIDNEEDWKSNQEMLKKADIAFEFSMPETAITNIKRCFDHGIAVVSGTTGWDQPDSGINDLCINGGHSFFYASNFSPAMNIMFELNKKLASMMAQLEGYQVLIEEIHHEGKKDAPSGTAITLANGIINLHPDKLRWVNKPASTKEDLEIISIRRNQVPGTHSIKYNSDIDSLELKHTAHSRKGFALGAIMAAEWLYGKQGCFGMQDLLNDTP